MKDPELVRSLESDVWSGAWWTALFAIVLIIAIQIGERYHIALQGVMFGISAHKFVRDLAVYTHVKNSE